MAQNFLVIPGRRHARQLGFRTLNFDLSGSGPVARQGIYAGWVEIDGTRHRAAIHYGPRPMLNETDPSLEAHLIDVELVEPPRQAAVEFCYRLRDIRTFPSRKALVAQITQDVEQTRILVKESP